MLQVVPVLDEPRGAHDPQRAATALSSRRTIVTTDGKAGFAELPGVAALVVGP